MTCDSCCHETRNAMAAVVHLAKKVRKANPSLDSALLDAAIERLDRQQKVCAGKKEDVQ
jgi:hypothetical protein